ncbi:MAG: hypothetical protein IJQ47_01005 [Synergistaceae bacterium]|nr:hypothetical protein [Synergistaceae bacterium]MBR0232611.1 hypothetical protein [Synergistaceae bacterium]
MTSNDQAVYIREDVFNARMDAMMTEIRLMNEKLSNELHNEIKSVKTELHNEIQGVKTELHNEIQGVKAELHAEIQDVKVETRMNTQQTADLQTSVYWGFALMTIFIALSGFMISLAPTFLEHFREKQKSKKYVTHDEVKDIVGYAVEKALAKFTLSAGR